MPRLPESFFATGRRWLEPFAASFSTLFLLWTAFVAFLWLSGWGDAQITAAVQIEELRKALSLVVGAADEIWIFLAAANIYLSLAASDGVRVARRWSVIALVTAWGVAALSLRFGVPLGSIKYTEQLGRHIGPVPIAFPFLWFAILFGARAFALRCAPSRSHAQIALLTGVLAMAADCNLERVASKIRAWWLWHPLDVIAPKWPPATTCLTWLAVSAALAYLFRPHDVVAKAQRDRLGPAPVFLIMNVVFSLAGFWRAA